MILSGDYQSAIDIFSYGLCSIQENMLLESNLVGQDSPLFTIPVQQIHTRGWANGCAADQSPSSNSGADATLAQDQLCVDAMHSLNRPLLESSSTEVDPFLFHEPLSCSRNKMYVYTLEGFAFMMVFNLALSYHLLGERVSHQTKDLRSALDLYELAYKMQLTEDVQVSLVHSCAMVNNMGQLQMRLHNRSAANWCFSTLLSILMFYVTDELKRRHDNADMTSTLDDLLDRCLEGFFESASTQVLKDKVSAAAA